MGREEQGPKRRGGGGGNAAGGGRGRGRNVCRYCRERVEEVDYKDLGSLQRLLTSRGKIYSRTRSGNCAKHQRSAKRAIKRARQLSLLPYTI